MKRKKKLTPLTICHLLVMAVLVVSSLVSMLQTVISAAGVNDPAFQEWKSPMYLSALMSIFDAIALVCGVLYLLNGYSKRAARFYRAFLMNAALSDVAGILANYLVTGTHTPLEGVSGVSGSASSARMLFLAGEAALLIILAFAKDLGKRRSWAFFTALIMLNVIMALLSVTNAALLWTAIAKSLARLVMTGTIGLAILGKYADKRRRGTT